MSAVTSVIIVCPSGNARRRGLEKHGGLWISEVNLWLKENYIYAKEEEDYPLFQEVDCDQTAGHKHPESATYIGGFNYFPNREFVRFFNGLKWPRAQLLILDTANWDDCPHLVFPPPEEKDYNRGGFTINGTGE